MRVFTAAIQIICVIKELSELLQFTNNMFTIHKLVEIIIQHKQI